MCHPCPPATGWDATAAKRTLSARAERKTTKYADRCKAMGARFSPLVSGVWGSMAPGGADLWSELQRRLASHVAGPARSRYISELQQGLSLALYKGIASQLRAIHIITETGYGEAATGPSSPPEPSFNDTPSSHTPAEDTSVPMD